jgi:hypothetical protein
MFIEEALIYFPKLRRSDIWRISLLRSLETAMGFFQHHAPTELKARCLTF